MKKVLLLLLALSFAVFGALPERRVMLELFTSTTCPPCVAGNASLTSIISNSGKYVAAVRYHMYWPSPGNDPFYHYNTAENGARRSNYGCNSVPMLFIDGVQSNITQLAVDSRHNVPSPFSMKAYRSYDNFTAYSADQGSGMFVVEIKNEDSKAYSFSLFGALVENDVAYTGTNGDPMHHQVMIDMIPYAYGLKVDIEPGETKSIGYDYNVDDTVKLLNTLLEPTGEVHIVDAKKCELVFWCQDKTTKEIYQSAKVAVEGSKPLFVEELEVSDASGDGIISKDEEAYVHAKIRNGSSAKMSKVHMLVEVDNTGILVVKGSYEIPEIPANGSVTISGKEIVIKGGSAYDGKEFNLKCYAGSGSTDASLGWSTKKLNSGISETGTGAFAPAFPSVARAGSSIKLAGFGGIAGECRITMFDASGRLVEGLYAGRASGLNELTIPSVPGGLYFIRVETSAGKQTYKVVLLD